MLGLSAPHICGQAEHAPPIRLELSSGQGWPPSVAISCRLLPGVPSKAPKDLRGPSASLRPHLFHTLPEEIHLGQTLLQVGEPEASLSLGQLIDEARGRMEPHFLALLAGQKPQGRGQMGLAGAAVAHQDQILPAVQILPWARAKILALLSEGT